MPATAFKLVGGWKKLRHIMDASRFDTALKQEVRRATLMNALAAVREIRAGITGGKYSPNAALSIALKRSSKPLVQSPALLFQAVTHQLLDYKTAFVGVIRQGKQDGEGLVDLAAVVHEGVTIQVTDAMRGLFFLLWQLTTGHISGLPSMTPRMTELFEAAKRAHLIIKPLAESTTAIVIPPRPFLRKPLEDPGLIAGFGKRWQDAVDRALRARGGA